MPVGGAGLHTQPTQCPTLEPWPEQGPLRALGGEETPPGCRGGGIPGGQGQRAGWGTGGVVGKAGLTHRQGWMRPQTTILGEEGTRPEQPQRWSPWGHWG